MFMIIEDALCSISASISFRFLIPVGIDSWYPEKQRRVAPYISEKDDAPTKYLFGRFKMRYVAPILLYFLQITCRPSGPQ